jgi:DNA polymerase-3 subunit gamma/tau
VTYTVLARRWRPTKFAEVVGQEHITITLQNALASGRVAHAYILTGPRGIGKTSTARILARAVNCLKGPAPEPCNECEICRQILDERCLDVVEIDGASNNSVEDVRRLRETVRLAPVSARKKVYIIDEVHMLTTPAFNALLKTLEEPPEHILFIFATTEIHKVPFTIQSRCQRFDFHRIAPEAMVTHLRKICEKEHISIADEALDIIARKAEGALRDAEGLLDQLVAYAGADIPFDAVREVLGILPREVIERTTEIIADHNFAAALPQLGQLASTGVDYGELLRSLQHYWMDMLFLKAGQTPSMPDKEREILRALADKFSSEDLLRLIKLASEAESELRRSLNPRTRFDVAFLRWVGLDRSVQIADILATLRGGGPASAGPTSGAPSAPLVTTVVSEELPAVSAPEKKSSNPAEKPSKSAASEKVPPKDRSAKTGEGTIDMLVEKFGGEVVKVEEPKKTPPKQK